MGVAVAAEDVFQRRIHHPYNLLPVDALVSIDGLEWGGIDDEQLQMGSKAIDDGVVDVLVAEAVADHHQPSRWSCEHSAKLIVVPGQNRKAAFADGFCTAHDDDALAAIGLYPIHGTVEFHVRLRAAPGDGGEGWMGLDDRELVVSRAGRRIRLHVTHAGTLEMTPVHRRPDVRIVMLLQQSVLIEREDGVKPAQESSHGMLDAWRVLKFELGLHEGLVHAVEDPDHRREQRFVALLVLRIARKSENRP